MNLEPCPFCGAKAEMSFSAWQVRCTQCICTGKTFRTKEQAIDWWNTRKARQPLTDEQVSIGSSIKDALEYALKVFEHLHNTQTYQGDNQDFSDEIITMRAALAELEQAQTVEPATLNTCLSNAKQEESGWLRAIDEALVCHHVDVANASDTYEQAKDKLNKLLCVVQDIGAYFAKQEPAQAVESVPVAYGLPNTAITGSNQKLMQVRLDIPSDDQYGGALWVPLYLNPHTAPPAIDYDDDTKRMVLELCDAVYGHVAVWTYPYGRQVRELAKQIREKLEAGK